MSRANEPAAPATELNSDGTVYAQWFGLSKRELFAAMAMQGLLSNLSTLRKDEDFADHDIEAFARMRADALLAELAKAQS